MSEIYDILTFFSCRDEACLVSTGNAIILSAQEVPENH